MIAASLTTAVVLAIIATLAADKVYEATAVFQVSIPNAPAGESSDFGNQGLARNYATLLVSSGFLQTAGESLDPPRSADDLATVLSTSQLEETSLIQLHARASTPEDAEQLAAHVATEFITMLQRTAGERSARQQQAIRREVDRIDARIAELDSNTESNEIAALRDSRDALEQQAATIVANSVAFGSSVTLAADPTANSIPVSPRPFMNLAAAILLGLVVGIAIVLLREKLGAVVLSGENASEVVGATLLASIPLQRRLAPQDPALLEAYEILYANIAFRGRSDNLRVFTVGSQGPGEGKTSVVEGLGRAAARSGARVLLIDGDMRLATLSNRLDAKGTGLSNVVQEGLDAEEAVVEISDGLFLLPAGDHPASSPSLLQSARMRSVLNELQANYDLTLIDTPPLAHLADGTILASLSDSLLIVARAGSTRISDLRAGVRLVRQANTPILGVIALEQRSMDKSYYRASERHRSTPGTARTPH